MTVGRLRRFLGGVRRVVDPGDGAPDEHLLRRYALASDQPAFRELVRRHGPLVLGVCRRVLGHEQDAEDAFQATFLVLARRAGAVAGRGPLANWLHGVARRTALAARRAAARRRAAESNARPPDRAYDGERDDLRAALDREVAGLPRRHRAVLILADLEGRTRREVAAELGVPEGTVASRLSRARAMLAARLIRRGWGAVLTAAAGCVRPPLATAAVEAAGAFVAGRPGPAPGPASLATEVLRAMWWTKEKVLAVAAAAVTLVGGLALVPAAGGPAPGGRPDAPKAVAVAAQREAGGQPGVKPPAAAPEKLEDTLLALEKKAWEALKGGDRKAAAAVLADDFVAVTSDGERHTRAEFLKLLADLRVTDYSLSEAKLTQLTPDAAVLTYRVRSEYTYKGDADTDTVWVSSAWAKRDGKWVNVLYHETEVK